MPFGVAARIAMLPVALAVAPWWNCNLRFQPHDDDDLLVPAHIATPATPGYRTNERTERAPVEERHKPPAKDPPLIIRDDLVVHALDKLRPSFTRCYKRAQNADPSLGSLKVQLRIYVDPSGTVMDAFADVEDPKLSNCLTLIARTLIFPAPGEMAMAYVAFAW